MRLFCALGLALLIARPAHAEEPQTQPERVVVKHVSGKRRAAAVALAIVPGIVVHGIGAWTVGEKRAAKKLFIGEALGVGVAGLSGLLVGGSGGNPYTVPAVPIVVAGSGLILQSWIEDIFIAAGGENYRGQPRAVAPWSVELGTSWLHDAYRERVLLRGGGHIELFGRVVVGAQALVDAGGDAKIGEANARVRILGAPATGALIQDGSRLTARLGSRWHKDDDDRVTQWTQEIGIDGRLDLDRIDRAFRRTFVEAGAGVGIVHVSYGDVATDWSGELLAHFAWGAYLCTRGEATLFYEHTRDGLVGGIPAWRASGFVGSVGATVDVRLHGPWAVRGELAIGNAYLTTLAVAYRGGPQ